MGIVLVETNRWQSKMILVWDGLRPFFDLAVGREVVPRMAALLVEQSPSRIVRPAIWEWDLTYRSVAYLLAVPARASVHCMPIRSVLGHISDLDHVAVRKQRRPLRKFVEDDDVNEFCQSQTAGQPMSGHRPGKTSPGAAPICDAVVHGPRGKHSTCPTRRG